MLRSAVLVLPLLAVVAGVPAVAATHTPADQQPLVTSAPPAGMPTGVPPAATAAEPVLPAPAPSVWPFGEHWSRTEGSGELAAGASFWTDFVDDDHGAGFEGLPIGADSLTSDLAPTQGVYSYPTAAAHANGADIFRSAVGVAADGTSYWRVDWNTLADPTVPAAEWVWGGTTDHAWAHDAGVTSTGADDSLFVSSRGALLTVGGVVTHLPVTVDTDARSFVVAVPPADLTTAGTIQLHLGSGIADAAGTDFAAPTKPVPSNAVLTALGGVGAPTFADNLMNVTYRTVAQEPPQYTPTTPDGQVLAALKAVLATGPLDPTGIENYDTLITGNFWMDDDQADTLAQGDVTKFGLALDWSQLAARATTPEPLPTGYSNRWYVSSLDLGQGTVKDSGSGTGDLLPNYLGRVQPYAVYVPTGYTGTAATPLTWVLHSLGVNLNQYGALDPELLQELCQGRGSICATTEGFGPDLWYFDDGENDYWSVWHALATAYRLDPDRTVVGGYSMGGWAAYKLGLEHPDLYAQAYALEGPPICGLQVVNGVGSSAGAGATGHCSADGASAPLLVNARWVPYSFTVGYADQLVPVTSSLQQQQLFDALGYRTQVFQYPAEDHLVYATQDRFPDVVATVGTGPRTSDPGHVTYAWFPDLTVPSLGIGATTAYWVSGLAARTTAGGTVATVDAVSAGRPDPTVTVSQPPPTPVTTPTPGLRFDTDWVLGAAPVASDALTLTLTDVAALTVDAPRAGLRCPAITVTSDGPSSLRVTGTAAGTRTFAVPAGTTTYPTCGAAATGASGTGGATAAGRAGGSLAVTGGTAAVPVLALGLVAGGAALRRRRTR